MISVLLSRIQMKVRRSTLSRTDVLLWFSGFLFLFLEVVLFAGLRFTTTYLYAHLIIALSILGLLCGGVLAAHIHRERIHIYVRHTVYVLVSAPLLGFVGVLISAAYPWGSAAVLVAVFAPLGLLIGLLYRIADPARAYAFELFGAALGVGGAAVLLPLIRAENALLIALVLTIGIAAVLWVRARPRARTVCFIILFSVAVALVYNNLTYDRLNFVHLALCDIGRTAYVDAQGTPPKFFCELRHQQQSEPYELILSRGSIVDRVDIAHFPGQQTYLTSFSGAQTDVIQPHESSAYAHDARIPTSLFSQPRVLVIGMGAEGVGKVVEQTGATEVTALDLNPVITNIWRTHKDIIAYSKRAYQGAEIHTVDGRSYLESTDTQFDLITMMNTHRTRNVAYFGEPDFLHTKEAFVRIFARLTEEGVLIFEEPNFFDRGREPIQKILATLQSALTDSGIADPQKHIALYTWAGAPAGVEELEETPFSYVQFFVSKSPLSASDIRALETWSQEAALTSHRTKENNMVFDEWLWPPALANPAASSSALVRILEDADSDNTPLLTDNRPFPTPVPLSRAMVLGGLLVVLTFCATVWWYVRRYVRAPRRGIAITGYFICIGFGYAAMEVLLLQWFNLYLGSVPLSFVVTLGGMLVASGTASIYARVRDTALLRAFAYCLPLLALGIAGTLVLPDLWYPDSFLLRTAIALSISIYLGGVLGLFFPRVLSLVKHKTTWPVTVLVGLNGSALAVGIVGAFFVTSWWGFVALGVCVVGLYGAAWILLRFTSLVP